MDTSDIIPKESYDFLAAKLPSFKPLKLLDGIFDMSKSKIFIIEFYNSERKAQFYSS